MCKKNHLTILLLAIAVFYNYSFAQTNNSWNIFTSFKEVKDLSIYGTKVWAASTGGLFSFDYNSPQTSLVKYTTMNGLLRNELTSVIVDNTGNVWTGSNDGAITLLNPSTGIWKTNSDILNSTEPSKSINNIFQYGNFAYISTDFSIIKMKISSFEIIDQPYTHFGNLNVPDPVYETTVKNDTIWAATKNGIAYANINNYLPIQTSWGNFTMSNSILKINQINTVAYFNNRVFFGTDSGMVYHENGVLYEYAPLYNGNPVRLPIRKLTVSNNSLYIASYKSGDYIFKVDVSNTNSAQLVSQGQAINGVKVNDAGELFLGTLYKGVDYIKNGADNYIEPNSPYSNLMFNLTVDTRGNVWGVSGSLGDWASQSGVYMYNNESWKNYLYSTYPAMGNGCCGWVSAYASKFSNAVYFGGWGNGLLRIDGDSVTRFNGFNSILQPQNSEFVLTYGVCEDNNANLWVLNNYTTAPIVNLTAGVAYPTPVGNSAGTFFTFMTIDNYNTKWMLLHNNEGTQRGVMYFNESANTGNLLAYNNLGADVSAVNDIALDKNGEVWIATNNGVIIIPDPYQVIQNPSSIPATTKMRIIENGISTPLTENVFSISVDALNNKWLGTFSNGLLYVSPDGSTLLNRITASNSRLTDNKINDIAVDQASGKAYFGTPNGLNSLGTIAVIAQEDCSDIKAGPNPFVIPSSSLLRIEGLVSESTVKILTVSGTLVAEFESPGGKIANWDGKDQNGSYVSSGIYFIVGYNKDGSKVCTGKVAIVRK